MVKTQDLPGGIVDKNPPASAGDLGSIPGLGRFHMPWSNKAHVPELLSLSSRALELLTTEPTHCNYWRSPCAPRPACSNYWVHVLQPLKPEYLELMLCNSRSHWNEKPMHRNEEYPPLTAIRESQHSSKDPGQLKKTSFQCRRRRFVQSLVKELRSQLAHDQKIKKKRKRSCRLFDLKRYLGHC